MLILGFFHEVVIEMFGGGSVRVLGLEFGGLILEGSSSSSGGFGFKDLAWSLKITKRLLFHRVFSLYARRWLGSCHTVFHRDMRSLFYVFDN